LTIPRDHDARIGRESEIEAQAGIEKLVALVHRLRAPDGCPWDRQQTLADVRTYLLEEAHEAADAIDRGDHEDLCGELGDLLFQIVFIAVLGSEQKAFDLSQVIDGIHAKMIARHPHVFGEEKLADADAVRQAWETRKARQNQGRRSLLAGVPASVPALLAAYRMTQKAAGVGFDWPNLDGVWAKVHEELAELKEVTDQLQLEPAEGDPAAGTAKEASKTKEAVREELGDLLFALVNLGRKLDLDPEAALAAANLKFRRRFGGVEEALERQGVLPGEATLQQMDALWDEIKQRERQPEPPE
jgi:MazG family protein